MRSAGRHAKRGLSLSTAFSIVLSGVFLVPLAIDKSPAFGAAETCEPSSTSPSAGTGTVSYARSGNFCYLAFKNTGAVNTQTSFSWTVPAGVSAGDVLVVGGGGAGGSRHAGGGGAGGYVEVEDFVLSPGTGVSVTVGAGGEGAAGNSTYQGSNGEDSSFKVGANGLTALGGGFGSYHQTAGTGGSGGGSGWNETPGNADSGTQTQFNGTTISGASFGNSGASGAREVVSGSDFWAGGGGGGAAETGQQPTNMTSASVAVAGAGGSGKSPSWLPVGLQSTLGVGETQGSNIFFAGGGGGGMGADGVSGGPGGTGGGGDGFKFSLPISSNHGADHTGGGGGSSGFDDNDRPDIGYSNPPGADGGSGVVVVRYSLERPADVTGLQVTSTRYTDDDSSSDQVSLSWSQAAAQTPAVTGYEVRYSTNSDMSSASTQTVSGIATTTATVTGLDDGKTYYFQVFATNDEADGSGIEISNSSATVADRAVSKDDYALAYDESFTTLGTSNVIPNSTAASFSVEAWIKPTTIDSYHVITEQRNSTSSDSGYFWLGLDDDVAGGVIEVWKNSSQVISYQPSSLLNRWTHVAVTVTTNQTIKLYVDGTLVESASVTQTAVTGSNFSIGSEANGSYPFTGEIDQVKVWSDVLSDSEVEDSMHAWQADTDYDGTDDLDNLISHYDFNDNTQAGVLRDMYGDDDLTITSGATGDFESLVNRPTRTGYEVYEFTRSYLTSGGGWTPPSGISSVDGLVVGGGGGGAGNTAVDFVSSGGAGGGGGVYPASSVPISGVAEIKVGQGGLGGESVPNTTRAGASGKPGQTSSLEGLTAGGGGGGGCETFASSGSCPDGESIHGLDGNAAGNGGSPSNFYNAYNAGNSGTASSANINGASFSAISGFGGAGYNANSGGSGSGGSGSAGGAGGAGTYITPGAGVSSSITGTATSYGGGGYGRDPGNSSSWSSYSPATNSGFGGKGAFSSAAATGVSGSAGVIVLAYQTASVSSSGPTDETALSTQAATFTVSTSGSVGTLSYQWQVSTDSGSNWSNVSTGSGGTTTSYTTAALATSDNGNQYRVQITSSINGTSSTSNSSVATLTVNDIVSSSRIVYFNASDTNSFDPDSSSTSVSDLSGNDYDASIVTNSGNSVDRDDQAFNFDGSESYIDVPDLPEISYANGITVDFVADFGTVGSWERIIDFGNGAPSDNIIVARPGNEPNNIQFEFYGLADEDYVAPADGKMSVKFAGAIAAGLNRYTLVADGSDIVLYRNGVSYSSISGITRSIQAGAVDDLPKTALRQNNFIGESNWSGDSIFSGKIRHVQVFNQALTPSQVEITYNTVTFDSNGGTDPDDLVTSGQIRLPSPGTRTGYTFAGWHADETYSSSLGVANALYTPGDTSLHAEWTANDYNITWDANGGTLAGDEASTFPTGGSIAEPSAPSRSGYNFLGWSTSETSNNGDSGNRISSWPYSPGVTSDITLYAEWEVSIAITTPSSGLSATFDEAYSLSISTSGGTGGNSFSATGLGSGLSINSSTGVISGTPDSTTDLTVTVTVTDSGSNTATTSSFAITIAQKTLSNSSAPTVSAPSGELKQLAASWDAVSNASSYTVKLYNAAGDTVLATVTGISGTSTTLTTSQYGSFADDTEYKVSVTAVGTGNYVSGAESSLSSAVRTNKTYTVTFNKGDDGTGADQTDTKVTGATLVLPDSDTANGWFTRTGYTVSSFATNSDGSGTSYSFGGNYTADADETLYPVWTADTNTVTFKSNYSGGPSDSTQTITTDQATALNQSFSRTGYAFDEWNTSADGSGTSYTLTETVTITGDLTLYAQWTAATYTLTYDYNSATGGNDDASHDYTTGGVVITLPTPTRTGYTFDGWYLDSGFSGSALGETTTLTADDDAYAKWSANTYTVIYDYNDATGGNSTASDTYTTAGSTITLPTPTRTGYTFGGWYEASDFSGSALSSPYTTSANRTIYAKWTAVDYSVTYNTTSADSGSAPTDSTDYNIGDTVSVAGNSGNLVRAGYDFGGWALNSSGTGTIYDSGDTITVSTSDIDLYPKWNPGTYTITYSNNGGTGSPEDATDSFTTGDSALTLTGRGTLAKTGYSFLGWNASASGTTALGGYTTNQDVTLYAVWELVDYDLVYDLNGGTGTAPTTQSANITETVTVTGIGSATKGGHWFSGWNTAANGSGTSLAAGSSTSIPVGDQTVYAIWVPNEYRISYNANGGSGGPDLSSTDGFDIATFGSPYTIRSKGDIARVGHTFDHWTTNAAGTGNTYDAAQDVIGELTSFTPTQNTVFYAQWSKVDYSLSFVNPNGSASIGTQTRTYGQILTMPSAGTRTGYTFAGWSDGSVVYPQGSTYNVAAANKTFTATWTPDVYTISYDWQGGSGTPVSGSSFLSYTVGSGDMTLPSVGDFTRDGYEFAGWSETSGGSAVSDYQPDSDQVLYAVWSSGNYTLTFDLNGGTGISTSALVPITESRTLPEPTRAGFVLTGWYDSDIGGSKFGNAGDSFTPTASDTYHARWVQRSLFGVDEATLESASQTLTATAAGGADQSGSITSGDTSASISVPAGSLPAGTVITTKYFKDTVRQSALIEGDNNYFFSVLVSWLYGSGDSATVPDTDSDIPVSVTLTNSAIKAGARIYQVIGDQVTDLGVATTDGTVTVDLYEDPEIVVASTKPDAPTAVSGVSGNTEVTVSWTAPANNGGAQITSYTATSSAGQTCTTATTSCVITGLTNGTSYTFTVTATNSVGTSSASTASASVTPALATYVVTYNSNSGSSVGNGSFADGGSIASAPADPTRSGFTFNGWSTTKDDAATKVTFPYTPGVSSNITLFALWTAVSSGGSGSGGSGGSTPDPVVPDTTPERDPSESKIGYVPEAPKETSSPSSSESAVSFKTDAPKETLVADGGSWTIQLKPEQTVVEPVTEELTLKSKVTGNVEVIANGLRPNSYLEIWAFSDPVFIGEFETDNLGQITSEIELPESLLPGQHTLQFGTLNSTGALITVNIPITVEGKVTVGTFKGYIAIYTKDLEGQRLSAKVAGKWLVQDPIDTFKDFGYSRVVRFTGAGYNILVDVYINRQFFERTTTRTR